MPLAENPDKPELYCSNCNAVYEVWYSGQTSSTVHEKLPNYVQ